MKPYTMLRSELTKHDMNRDEFAARIDRSVAYVIKRMTAHATWDQADIWKTMTLFGIPSERMHEYFGREQVK